MPSITDRVQAALIRVLRFVERYTKTDMVYLARGSFWLTAEQAMGILFSLGLAVAFGHFASKDMYGNYKYVLSLAGLLSAVSLSGLPDAMSGAVARGHHGALWQSFKIQLRWSWPFIIASFLASGYYFYIHNEFVGGALLIVGILQPLLAAVTLFPGFLYSKRDFARGSFYSIAMNGVTSGAVFLAIYLGERAIILVATYFIVRTLIAAFFFWRTLKHTDNQDEDASLLHFGFHLSAINILSAIGDKIDNVIIFTLLGPTQLATYSFAIAMPEQIKGVVKNLYGLALPKLAGRTFSEIKQGIWSKMVVVTLFLLCVVSIYIFLAPYVFTVLFPLYTDAVEYSRWYALSIIAAGIPPVIVAAFTAHKKTKALYMSLNGASVVLMIALAILVPLYGLAGAIAAQIIYRVAILLFTLILLFTTHD